MPQLRAASVFAIVSAAMAVASSVMADDILWRPYFEAHVRAGDAAEVGQGNVFLPLLEDDASMLFADLRGQWTDEQAAEGNFGLAYRQIMSNDWIVGGYAFYDLRHSRFNNNFQQFTVGAELLNACNGLRVNGYIPDRDADDAPQLNTATTLGEERAYYGVDFEYERLVLSPHVFCDCEVWAAVGVFHFNNDTEGYEDITGPRARVEMRAFDVPLLGVDSRVVLAGQIENDDIRGTVGTGTVTLRIPFGRGGGASGYRLAGIDRRMVAPIVRDIDIITSTSSIPNPDLGPTTITSTGSGDPPLDEFDINDVQSWGNLPIY
ncbi:MAG: inverse autotransporter beta domain-containing protein [Planctomycetales bacterium]|nr:inverse autotransporter beta domain-containing protein [Planctomycetales bacterium]